jgi:4'-phosphopantetheinyl transferase
MEKPTAPELDAGNPGEGLARVDLWLASVENSDDVRANRARLDDAERARADRFRFQEDATRFVNRRAFRREVLARYVGVDPTDLRFDASDHGRPGLEGYAGLSFSCSHASGLAVAAVLRDGVVGVDAERCRPVPDAAAIATDLLHPSEARVVRSLPAADRSDAFLQLWTRKEAVAKANGAGLSLRLDSWTVAGEDPGETTRASVRIVDVPYTVIDVCLPGPYVGAVAVRGADVHFTVTHRAIA